MFIRDAKIRIKLISGGSKEGCKGHAPLGPNSFNFMQFF